MAKGVMYIDGQRVPFDGEKNVLTVIRKAGIDMPTFCYYSELSTFGACRMCVVEDEKGKIDASCSMEPRDGMVIRTNTARLLKHRRMILELMLSSHCRDCTTCEKSGSAPNKFKRKTAAALSRETSKRMTPARKSLTPRAPAPETLPKVKLPDKILERTRR